MCETEREQRFNRRQENLKREEESVQRGEGFKGMRVFGWRGYECVELGIRDARMCERGASYVQGSEVGGVCMCAELSEGGCLDPYPGRFGARVNRLSGG